MSNKHIFFSPKISSDHPESATPSVAVIECLLKGYQVKLDEHSLSVVNQQIESPQSLHELAKRAELFGFELELVTAPADLLLSDLSVLPILVAGRTSVDTEPSVSPLERFIVIWNKVGPFFQVVDNQSGRHWLRHADLLSLLAAETVTLSPASSQDVLESESFQSLLRSRMRNLGADAIATDQLLLEAVEETSSGERVDLLLLDAAVRFVFDMVQERAVRRGESALEVLHALVKSAAMNPSLIPEEYWSREVISQTMPDAPPPISLHAVAVLRIQRLDKEKFNTWVATTGHEASAEIEDKTPSVSENAEEEQTSPASNESSPQQAEDSAFDVTKFLLADGILPLAMWITIIILAAIGVFFQAILFRGMMNLLTTFNSLSQRLWLVGLISAFITTIVLFQWFIEQIGYSMGQRLNSRLRLTFFSMLPNLSSHYFRDSSPAQIVDRIHSGRTAEWMPFFFQYAILLLFQILFTVAGVIWIDGLSGFLVTLMVVALIFGMVRRIQLQDQLMEVFEQRGRLSQFYRDAMQGLVAIRTHSAERAARREYESTLAIWGQKMLNFQVSEMWFWAYDAVITYILISVIIIIYVVRASDLSNLLLLAYWCINIDQLARNQLAGIVLGALLSFVNLKRYGTILDVPPERDLISAKGSDADSTDSNLFAPSIDHEWEKNSDGMAIAIQQVRVRVGEHVLLKNVTLDIPAGSHVAVVGTSGAGKSTLIGLLLGWHYPDSGQLLIDNQPLNYEGLLQLRQETAWVDPSIQLWNRSLLYNLYYAGQQVPLNIVIEQADLRGVLERLEHGLQTPLGSEGRSLSGGQGQRVRFGRALQRKNARLVILDEAFRGLDRGKRRTLLARARQFWSKSTLICVTHDVGQTLDFERVLVLHNGELIEDGNPLTLAKQPDSRYAALLTAEENVHDKLWSKYNWRRLWLDRGQLTDRTDDHATH